MRDFQYENQLFADVIITSVIIDRIHQVSILNNNQHF